MVHTDNEAHLLSTADLQVVPKQMDAWLDSKREGLDRTLPYVGQVAFTFGLGYAGACAYQLVRRNKHRAPCPSKFRCKSGLKFVAGAFILGNVARIAFTTPTEGHHHNCARRSSAEPNSIPTPESSTHRACPFTAKPSPAEHDTTTSSESNSRRACPLTAKPASDAAAEPGVTPESNTRACPFTAKPSPAEHDTTTSSEPNSHRACPWTAKSASAGEATHTAHEPPCPSTFVRNGLASCLDTLHLGVIKDKLGPSGLPEGPSAVAAASLGIWWGLRVL